MESLPQAVLQAGAIIFKSVVNNDQQCFYGKKQLETWIGNKCYNVFNTGKFDVVSALCTI